MAEYQKVEYWIGKDGKITEKVINASGSSCTTTTSGIEQALGEVENQELLPEYYEGYEQIGKPWEQVPYNPQIHQPDASDMTEGEMVYIRFVGYKHKEDILCPAKVSRTLPGKQ